MVVYAQSGGTIEVMGLMQGKTDSRLHHCNGRLYFACCLTIGECCWMVPFSSWLRMLAVWTYLEGYKPPDDPISEHH
ncbi:hypothetical protein Goari_015371 [Gossypium aridum]|uniref:Uncharacterized protein n=1 Tax=Gossypium aridum TaxID=34290 RepID=A0A7J8WGF4_GOSAI|nr:hypothetical protein [Gossypium aridum]